MKKEKENLHLKLSIKFECKEGETEEVKKRLTILIIESIKSMEGLLNTSILPWKKSYYFSVKEVKEHNGTTKNQMQQLQ